MKGTSFNKKKQAKPTPNPTPAPEPSPVHSGILWGAWLGRWAFPKEKTLESFTVLSGYKMDVVHTFVNTGQNLDQWMETMDYVASQGAINLLTLETEGQSTLDINKGAMDAYFAKLAKQLKGFGKEVWLRLFHEVNGNWYPWAIGDSKVNTNETVKAAFQRVVDIFRSNGARNVKFVYNVSNENVGAGASFMGAYPGDAYVDFNSIDGYNFGASQSWSKWKTFRQIFDTSYREITAKSAKPVLISETASSEKGGNKAVWIRDMKAQIAAGAYPLLKGLVWFDEKKETDWRINSSDAAMEAYKDGI